MAGPYRDDAEARELLARARLAEIRRARLEPAVVVWPGTALRVALRQLSNSEVQVCYAAAYKRFRELDLPIPTVTETMTREPFAAELEVQILVRACRDPEDLDRPFFAADAELRDEVEDDLRIKLFLLYREYSQAMSEASLTVAEYEAIVDLVKKKDARSLRLLAPSALVTFILTMAELPPTSPTST